MMSKEEIIRAKAKFIKDNAITLYFMSDYKADYSDYTIEEIKELIRINDKLKAYLDKLKSECTIKY